jgi:chromate reductase
MSEVIHVLAISGSLRKASFNTAALRAAMELKPEGMEIELATIGDFPLYSQDIEDQGWPGPVARVRHQVERSDGVLLATPEYNFTVSGVLKNAIDWLSRPAGQSPLNGKPVAIIGASPSMVGTARAQGDLRNIAFYNAMPVLTAQEVLIARAGEKFDKEGRLTDEPTRKFLGDFLRQLGGWIRRLRAQAA